MRARYLVLVALALAGSALAQSKSVEGVPIDLGDSIPKVKAAFGTTSEPEPSKSVERDTKMLCQRTKGICAFFHKEEKVDSIRLDAPFSGNVKGVKIGDPLTLLVQKLGKPVRLIKNPPGNPMLKNRQEPYVYYVDDNTTARFDFDRDDVVATIFIWSRSAEASAYGRIGEPQRKPSSN